jgi:DME family drug/metabolite transporter
MPISTLCLVLSGVLWGTGGLIGTLIGQAAGVSALSVAAYRLLAGGGLIVAYLTLTGRRPPAGRAAWTRIAVIGLLSALFQSCYFAAIALTSVSLATLVTIGGTPVIVAVVEHARRSRALGRSGVITIALALAGLGLLTGRPGGGLSETAVLASAGLALLSAAGFAAVTLLGTSPVAGLDELTLNGYAFSLGGLALLPVAAALGGGLGFRPTLASVGLLAALGDRPDRRRLHAVLPRAAEGVSEYRGPAFAHRTAYRRRARGAGAREPAERDRDRRGGDAAGRGGTHRAGWLRLGPRSRVGARWNSGPFDMRILTYSTVTLLARLRGLSMSRPSLAAAW